MPLVKFVFQAASSVNEVELVGEWNSYRPLSLKKNGCRFSGRFEIEPGTYLYRFRLNHSRLVTDPLNPRWLPDGHGSPASFLAVGINTKTVQSAATPPPCLHIPDERFVFHTETGVVVRIQVFDPGVISIILHGGCDLPMRKVFDSHLYSIHEAELSRKLANDHTWVFELVHDRKRSYLTATGWSRTKPRRCAGFVFPKQFRRPRAVSWLRETVFYHIFPDRFAKKEARQNLSGRRVEKWGGKPRLYNFFGGNFKGMRKRLSYLEGLGINAIYLNPIFKSSSNHRYDTDDYFKIDPLLGTERDLVTFVKDCHRRGIRVVLDGVFNHTGTNFFAFRDVLRQQEKSEYRNWFRIHSFPVSIEGGGRGYDGWAGYGHMPALNVEDPEVQSYIFKVARYWIRRADIDGWRLDVPFELPHWFWNRFREEIRKEKPDACLIGEIWEDGTMYSGGDEFDGVMNYRVKRALETLVSGARNSSFQFASELQRLYFTYSRQFFQGSMSLLSSHDVPRILTALKGSLWKFRMLYTILFTLPGAPSIYYGDEILLPGGMDPDCRRCMPWRNLTERQRRNRDFFKRLTRMRRSSESLTRGSLSFVEVKEEFIAFKRETNREKVCVLINKGPVRKSVKVTGEGRLEDILNNRPIEGDGTIICPARSVMVIRHCGR